MPSTIEELNAAIQDIASQANSILFLNHNILEEYERRQRKVTDCCTQCLFHASFHHMFYPAKFSLTDRGALSKTGIG